MGQAKIRSPIDLTPEMMPTARTGLADAVALPQLYPKWGDGIDVSIYTVESSKSWGFFRGYAI